MELLHRGTQDRVFFIIKAWIMGNIGGVFFLSTVFILGSINFIQSIIIIFHHVNSILIYFFKELLLKKKTALMKGIEHIANDTLKAHRVRRTGRS